MDDAQPSRARGRLRPTAYHFVGSLVVAGVGSWLLVRLWYPPPFATLAGGLALLALLLIVDIVLGPMLTLVIANPRKPLRVLARDMAVILVVQLAALGYGWFTLSIARPVGLVFEVDQFRVVSAADIEPSWLPEAPVALRQLSSSGPRTFAAVKPSDPAELFAAIQLGLAGVDLAMLPKYWREYASQRDAVIARSRPVALLVQRRPAVAAELDALAAQAGVPAADLRFLPLRARKMDDWVTLVAAPDARVVGHRHVDGKP